ncbi:MAG: FecR domain-containing protein, partial [Cyclobacteriaceae bacterium]|nr:FecR domain-containing protein [Cyclobacteriaceae bacterium]
DQKALENWVAESPKNERLFNEYQLVWEQTGKVGIDLGLDVEEAWGVTRTKLGLKSLAKTRSLTHRTVLKWAASVMLLALVGALYIIMSKGGEVLEHTGIAETKQIELPDGSVVWLNQNSSIRYQSKLRGDNRLIALSGEAFFDVVQDPLKPFIVSTPSIRTQVLGTSFNVRSLPEETQSKVVVVSGKVSVAIPDHEEFTVLGPGQSALYSQGQNRIIRTQNADINFLAWKDKQLIFENSTLTEIIPVLQKYFETTINIDGRDLAECQLTSSFDDPTLEEVLQVISLTMNLEYQKIGNEYVISGTGCHEQP